MTTQLGCPVLLSILEMMLAMQDGTATVPAITTTRPLLLLAGTANIQTISEFLLLLPTARSTAAAAADKDCCCYCRCHGCNQVC